MKKRHKIELPEVEPESPDLIESESSSSEATLATENCMQNDCPEIIDTPRFPSPTSCLSKERLHELEERIDAANRLLLDLGLSDKQREYGRRLLLDGLKGKKVKIKINCNKEAEEVKEDTSTAQTVSAHIEELMNKEQIMREKPVPRKRPKTKRVKKKGLQYKHKTKSKKQMKDIIKGTVQLVGRDFAELTHNKKTILIPFSQICLIMTKRRYNPPVHEPSLVDIDPCFRRELTFNFGDTVANDPELIQLFFRIHLTQYLKKHKGEKLTIQIGHEKMQGILKDIDADRLVFDAADGEPSSIPTESISYIMKN